MLNNSLYRIVSKFGIWRLGVAILSPTFTLIVPQISELEKAGIFFILMMCISCPLNIFAVGISKFVAEQNKNLSSRQFSNYSVLTAFITSVCASTFFVYLNSWSELSITDVTMIFICSGIAAINYLKIQRKIAIVKNFPAALVYFVQNVISITLSLISMLFTEDPIFWLTSYWGSQIFTVLYLDLRYSTGIELPSNASVQKYISFKIVFQFFYTGTTLYVIQFLLTNYHRILFSSAPDLVAIIHVGMAPVTGFLIFVDRFFYETHGKHILQSRKISKLNHKKVMSSYLRYQIPAMAFGITTSIFVLVVLFDHVLPDLIWTVLFIFICNFFFLMLVLYRQTNENLKKQNANLNIPNLVILFLIGIALFCSHKFQIEFKYVSSLILPVGLVFLILQRSFSRFSDNNN